MYQSVLFKIYNAYLPLAISTITSSGFVYGIVTNVNKNRYECIPVHNQIFHIMYFTGSGYLFSRIYPISIPYLLYNYLKK